MSNLNLKQLAEATGGTLVLAGGVGGPDKLKRSPDGNGFVKRDTPKVVAARNLKLINELRKKLDALEDPRDGDARDALIAAYDLKLQKLNEVKLTTKQKALAKKYLNYILTGDID